jgi:DNA-binding response OmpR family regulator
MKALQGHSILVVDDEAGLREILAEEIAGEGARVFQAASGNEALAVIAREKISAVVTDIRMPDGDGVFLLKELKKKDVNAPAVMLLTGFADLSLREAYDLGAESFFFKPFGLEEVLKALRQMLMDKRLLLEREVGFFAAEAELKVGLPALREAESRGLFRAGRGGFFLLQDRPLKAQTEIDFQLSFADGPLRGRGVVRWVSRRPESAEAEMGIEFSALEKPSMAEFLAWLAERKPRAFIPKG